MLQKSSELAVAVGGYTPGGSGRRAARRPRGPLASSAGAVPLLACQAAHGYMVSTYARHIVRNSRDFDPLLKPNSCPARALKASNTSGGTISCRGLVFPSAGRRSASIGFLVVGARRRGALSQSGSVDAHEASFATVVTATRRSTIDRSLAHAVQVVCCVSRSAIFTRMPVWASSPGDEPRDRRLAGAALL